MCAMNLPSIFAHMQKAHVCATQHCPCRVGGGAPRRWPPSAAQTARTVFPYAAFTKAPHGGRSNRRNQCDQVDKLILALVGLVDQCVDLLCSCRVDPVRQSPRTGMYGFFPQGTVPPPRPYSLASFPSRPSSPAAFPNPLPLSSMQDHAVLAALLVLHSPPSTDRASLATSLSLIGLLTPVPPGDPASPPEVTPCSSVPCRPQTPWCGG
jgi:hypothetical protein